VKILWENTILLKISICYRYGARRLLSEFPNKSWKLGSLSKTPLDGFSCPATRQQQAAFGAYSDERTLRRRTGGRRHAQLGRQAKNASAREVSHETVIPRLRVHRLIHRDLLRKCFKRRRAHLLSEANHVTRPSC